MSSVSEITQQLREIIQANPDLQDVWTRGRISNVTPGQNGVLNFTLTDNRDKIECTIFHNKTSIEKKMPAIGGNVFVKGGIYLCKTKSEYRFKVADINLSIDSSSSISVLINALRTTLSDTTAEVQGKIATVFVTRAAYTILKLEDGQSDGVIACVIPPAIDLPFSLETGKRVHVNGPFEVFTPKSSYQINIGETDNITQVVGPLMNECRECRQRFNNLQDQLCHICYHARLTYEGIVVGAVQRFFDAPRFSDFSTKREYEIRFGSKISGRADIALLNSKGKPEAIAECKRIGNNNKNNGIEQLEAYLSGSGAKLGLFADDTDPYGWTFLKKSDNRNWYDPITRPQFERKLGVEPTPEIPSTKTQLELVQNNIIKSEVDAIVNAADPNLTRGIGLDGAIRDAGGEKIGRECQEIFDREGVCPPGKAVITTGGNLPAKYVIHAVGPIWQGGNRSEPESLADCYRSSLQLATEKGIQSIAFPAISTGNFGFPIERAAHIALTTVKEFVEQAHQNNEMVPERIQFVLFDEEAYTCYVNAFSRLGFGLFSLIG
jgi:O-acetyl-ADP-ribose deacetylase (regulator of RNase III)